MAESGVIAVAFESADVVVVWLNDVDASGKQPVGDGLGFAEGDIVS